eukprot:7021055-Alexandrium_andersonii.AAC.1
MPATPHAQPDTPHALRPRQGHARAPRPAPAPKFHPACPRGAVSRAAALPRRDPTDAPRPVAPGGPSQGPPGRVRRTMPQRRPGPRH